MRTKPTTATVITMATTLLTACAARTAPPDPPSVDGEADALMSPAGDDPVSWFTEASLASRQETLLDEQMVALAHVWSGESGGRRLRAAHEAVFAGAFGERFVEGRSAIVTTPDHLPWVMSSEGRFAVFEDLEVFGPVAGLSDLDAGQAIFTYAGRLGTPTASVGLAIVFDLGAIGVPCPTTGCVNVAFAPWALMEEASPVTPSQAAEYKALRMAGQLEDLQSLRDWLGSHGGERAGSSAGASSGESADPGQRCDVTEVTICLDRVALRLQRLLQAADARFGPLIAAAQGDIARAERTFLGFVVGGAVTGTTGGALIGSATGPGIVVAAGSGFVAGIFGGAVGWIVAEDPDSLVAALERLTAQYRALRCNDMRTAFDDATACLREHCPALLELATSRMREGLVLAGC